MSDYLCPVVTFEIFFYFDLYYDSSDFIILSLCLFLYVLSSNLLTVALFLFLSRLELAGSSSMECDRLDREKSVLPLLLVYRSSSVLVSFSASVFVYLFHFCVCLLVFLSVSVSVFLAISISHQRL